MNDIFKGKGVFIKGKIYCCFLYIFLLFLGGCISSHKVLIDLEQNSEGFDIIVKDPKQVEIKNMNFIPRIGWINISPILDYENSKVEKIVLVIHKGIYFLVAKNFKNVWLIKPRSNGISAKATPVLLLKRVGNSPFLTVSDDKKWVILYYDQKMRFKINEKGKIMEIKQ